MQRRVGLEAQEACLTGLVPPTEHSWRILVLISALITPVIHFWTRSQHLLGVLNLFIHSKGMKSIHFAYSHLSGFHRHQCFPLNLDLPFISLSRVQAPSSFLSFYFFFLFFPFYYFLNIFYLSPSFSYFFNKIFRQNIYA